MSWLITITPSTIHSIPAPNYQLRDVFDPGDKTGFLRLIARVNERLKGGALALSWHFLDVYATTANEQGMSNQLWHIDQHHVQPKFYMEAERWLSRGSK